MGKRIIFLVLAVLLFFGAPLAITSLVLSQQEFSCNNVDMMGLDVSDYLLGLGIEQLISTFIIMTCIVYGLYHPVEGILIYFCFHIFISIFSFSWMIVGSIILFRSNVDCISIGTPQVIFALVMWCLTIVRILCYRIYKNEDVETTNV